MKNHEQLPLVPIRKGEGVWLEDFDGNRYIDAISSWWVNLFGHANPRINVAICEQLDCLEEEEIKTMAKVARGGIELATKE